MASFKEKLAKKIQSFPDSPGCYLMKNSRDEVIYVGKAKALKNRVRSYFNNSKKSIKTEILVGHIRDVDFMITKTETEAFVLENNLIKKYSPKYNIRLKDDKSYPYITVDLSKNFPRLIYTRRIKRKPKTQVFGPFTFGSNISEVLRTVVKSFRLRDCTDREMNSRKEPCLLYQMNQCTAPCVNYVSKEDYSKQVKTALNLFSGKGRKAIETLKNEMLGHAENEEFERAAQLRDHIESLETFVKSSLQKNAELNFKEKDIDIISLYAGELEVDLSIYLIRDNFLLGQKNFHFSQSDLNESLEEEVLKYILQYYSKTQEKLPKLLATELSPESRELLQSALDELFPEKIVVDEVKERFKSLYELTFVHARESQKVRLENRDSVYHGLEKLKDLLKLKEKPIVIECYDVAIWQGKSPTASKIVFHDGIPEKSKYRYYHLKELPEGNNDFEMMRATFERRIQKGELPDLFVVDGGKGQVNAAVKVLEELSVDIPLVGIAKARSEKESEERLIIPGRSNPYILNKNRSLLTLMVKMRDEAHRFSRVLHHKAEKKRIVTSELDLISGIGPKIKEKILSRLEMPLNEYRSFSRAKLCQYFDISPSIAAKIVSYFEMVDKGEEES